MEPQRGARIEFERIADHGGAAAYRVSIAMPGHTHVAELTIDDAAGPGPLAFVEEGHPVPTWAEDTVRAFARQLHHARKQGGAWPRKLRRWRGEE